MEDMLSILCPCSKKSSPPNDDTNTQNKSNKSGKTPDANAKQHNSQQVSIDSVSITCGANGVPKKASHNASISSRASVSVVSAVSSVTSASSTVEISTTLDNPTDHNHPNGPQTSITTPTDANPDQSGERSVEQSNNNNNNNHQRNGSLSTSLSFNNNRARSNTVEVVEDENKSMKIFNYDINDDNNDNKSKPRGSISRRNSNSKESSNVEVDMNDIAKAKIICFKDVNSDRNDEDLSKRECNVMIDSNDTKILFLSCYDPVCWVLSGEYLNNIEKVVICETKHSNLLRECWYPDGSLPRVKGIENLHNTCQIGLEMGFQSRYSSDFKASYYSQSETKQKRSKLMNYLENEYKCKVIQIIQCEVAPNNISV